METSAGMSFEGWNLGRFIKGREKLLVAVIGGLAGWIITNRPEFAGIAAAVAELGYSVIKYFVTKRSA